MREMSNRFSWFFSSTSVPQFSSLKESGFGHGDFDISLHRTRHPRAVFEQTLPPLAELRHGLPLPGLPCKLSETFSAQLTRRQELIRTNSQIVQQIHSQFRSLNSLRPLRKTCSNKDIIISRRPATVSGVTTVSSKEKFQRDGYSHERFHFFDQPSLPIEAAISDESHDVNCLAQASDVDMCVSQLNHFSLSVPKCHEQGGLGSINDSGAVSISHSISRLALSSLDAS